MSAHEQMRAMLDQLMGTGRDGENNKFKVHFTDPRVCKSFLLGCCPHDILAATMFIGPSKKNIHPFQSSDNKAPRETKAQKGRYRLRFLRMDLGECPKLHDLALRADFENASLKKDYFYDVDAMEHLQNFINECDRRTEQAKRRLAETQEELSAEVAAKLNKVHELAEQIGKKLAQAEKLGAEGNVEESMKTMEEVEDCRKQKAMAEQEYRNSMPASSYQQQKLRVCEVCSAYLGIHDNDRRLADHFGGKLHLGFITIREKLIELQAEVNEKRQKGRMERDRDYIREREEQRGGGGGGGRDWNRSWGGGDSREERSNSRTRQRRPRSRTPSRDRQPRHRSRSDERKKHAASRHHRRSRSRERRGGRGGDGDRGRSHRRDRSNEKYTKERGRRSRSRDRRRSHSEGNDKEENNLDE